MRSEVAERSVPKNQMTNMYRDLGDSDMGIDRTEGHERELDT